MKKETIEIKNINLRTVEIEVEGLTDLVLNKMNDVTVRQLTDERNNKAKTKEDINKWEQIITAIHWLKDIEVEYSEEGLQDKLINDIPCVTSFGLQKSFGQAVTRNGLDTYSVKFNANVMVLPEKGMLVPITFTNYSLNEMLMSPKRGAPVLTRLSQFSGWRAKFKVQFIDGGLYSLEQIVNIINLAGFGLGIGSSRNAGFGRYKVVGVKEV